MLSNRKMSQSISLEAQQKRRLRRKYLTLRNKLSSNQIKKDSRKILTNLKKIPQFQEAESFFIYVAHNNEVRTEELITKLLGQDKIVTVPRIIRNKTMIPVQVFNLSSLQKNHHGILEPVSIKKYPKKIDLAIVPGLAFTAKGDRVGMGGGYYDKFLAENSTVYAIGLGYSFQVVDKLPTTRWDRKVNQVVTEKKIF